MKLRSIRGPLAVSALLLGLAGCSSFDSRPSYQEAANIRWDPTPELDNLSMRRVDMDNRAALIMDTNLRMFNEDVDRALLLDRPSRLTPYATPR